MKKRIASSLLLIGSVIALSGCYSTREITTYGELSEAHNLPLSVLTADTTAYELSRFAFSDSLLRGEGEQLVAGRRLPFHGDIPLSHIARIQSQTVNVFGSILILGVIAAAATTAANTMPGAGLSVYRRMGGDGLLSSDLPLPGSLGVCTGP